MNKSEFPFEISNFIKLYEESFMKNWDYPAITDYRAGETLTYQELAREIAKLHIEFKLLEIKPGDKIAICGKDTINWCLAFLSTLLYGAIAVPILSDFPVQDIVNILNHSASVLIFADKTLLKNINNYDTSVLKWQIPLDGEGALFALYATEGRTNQIVNEINLQFSKRYPNGFQKSDIQYFHQDNDKVVEINYTSGTTGFSKGVMLTGENISGNICATHFGGVHWQYSRALNILPLAHTYGQVYNLLSPIAGGAHIYLLGKTPSPQILLKALKDVKPHVLHTVPLVLEKVYDKKIKPLLAKKHISFLLKTPILKNIFFKIIRSNLLKAFGGEMDVLILGGAPINTDVENFFSMINFPFLVCYGMTECAPLISYTAWREFIPGSCGQIIPTMEVKSLSSNPDIPGEICVRGVNVMKGYYKNPEATKAVLDENGWFKTGDMGTITNDGTIFLRGRSKTMILGANGQNIYPEEIESKLNQICFVNESLVVERNGKLIGIVYPDINALDKENMNSDTGISEVKKLIRNEINKKVAPYEQISKIEILFNEFEKTPKQSIKRFLYS